MRKRKVKVKVVEREKEVVNLEKKLAPYNYKGTTYVKRPPA